MILDDMCILNYDDVEAQLSQQNMMPTLRKNFFKQSHQRFWYKAQVSRTYNKGKINDAEKQMEYNRIDKARAVLNQSIS